MTSNDAFTPALGRPEWTGFYDIAIAIATREGRWRRALLDEIAPQSDELIVDVGCGTGTMLLALKARSPGSRLVGLDPDPAVLARAEQKMRGRIDDIALLVGFARDAARLAPDADKVFSSLVFHQVPMAEKRAGFGAIFAALKPGGAFHLCDYGLQRTALMRTLFKQVQNLDGFENTEPNARGVLPALLHQAGFSDVEERLVVPTPTGSISIYFARKPAL
ncbi:MAG: SAM-dependent methyltransferase [Alphaproteobacteria bacterium]|nr:MAG: SAM-dependent methyltransferase [Alphaproteobacteria bacterium]